MALLNTRCSHNLQDWEALIYHWRELLQVSFLMRQTVCRDKHVFCRDKSMLVVTNVLSGEKICRDKIFLWRQNFTTNICRDKHNFVVTKVLSREAYFFRDKRRVSPDITFVATLFHTLYSHNLQDWEALILHSSVVSLPPPPTHTHIYIWSWLHVTPKRDNIWSVRCFLNTEGLTGSLNSLGNEFQRTGPE